MSNKYVATFTWMDKLGLAARLGAEIVVKQTFFHGNYALVDDDLSPTPNYWLSLLHKRLVGQTVLDVKDGLQEKRVVRVYAHCTNTRTGLYERGAVTVMAVNLSPSQNAVLSFTGSMGSHRVDQYLLTSPYGDLTSKFVLLNGVRLTMPDDNILPTFKPVTLDTGRHVHIPPLALGFFVVREAQAPACIQFMESTQLSSNQQVTVNTSTGVQTASKKFLSVAFGSGLIQEHWAHFNFSSSRLFTLAKGLAPAYVRFGGTASCWLHYIPPSSTTLNRVLHKNFTDFNITSDDLDKIHLIASKAGWKVLFGLNVCLRTRDDTWNFTNPLQIIQYVARKGYKFGWELGNEPNHLGKFNRSIDPQVLGEDFVSLRALLDNHQGYGKVLVGPDITRPKKQSLGYLERFLSVAVDAVDAITWHQYYVNKRTCKLEDFYDPETFDYLLHQLQLLNSLLSDVAPNKRNWLGETATAVGGGAPGLSNTFVATLSWLDKLGLAARLGTEVIMKQTFFHGSYALVDDDLNPKPNYWLSLLHKRLVGQTVLDVKDGLQEKRIVRVYAHCTNTRTGQYNQGAVTVMAINLSPSRGALLSLSGSLRSHPVDQYLLTSPDGDITSQFVLLNGVRLTMPDDYTLPTLQHVTLDTGQDLHIPPLALGFFVVPKAQAPACTDIHWR